MDTGNLNALISLLDDPDDTIFEQIRNEVIMAGPPAIPALENAWENNIDPVFQQRIENIIHQIQTQETLKQLLEWAKSEQNNLIKAVLIIAAYQYPSLNQEKVLKQLDQIRKDIWLEINDNLTALEKVKIINHILFDVYELTGNKDNYHAIQNSLLNNVLESKKGNPLSLSIIYLIVSQSLGIPVYGVNLPEHFILAYVDVHQEQPSFEDIQQSPILFYINAFSKGIVFARNEIDHFLDQLKFEKRPQFYQPCTNLDIIKRMLRNMIIAFEKEKDTERKEEIELFLTKLEELKLK